MVEIVKNRNRGKYTFANINLLGRCNANCYFCLGKDICDRLSGKNQLNVPFSEWKNFDLFLKRCKEEGIRKLYLTGQTADGLQYYRLEGLIRYLQDDCGFSVGVRTNGYLAKQKLKALEMMRDEIGFSIHTMSPKVNKLIMGREDMPDWDSLLRKFENTRVSIVLNRYNVGEFWTLMDFLSKYENVRYIQVRRICTETRTDLLQKDIDLYETFFEGFSRAFEEYRIDDFYGAERYIVYGKEVNFWRTVETSVNSLNYFTDGTCSDNYFIVEGYCNNEGTAFGRK